LDALLRVRGGGLDVYDLVDGQKVRDVQIMHRLHSLAAAGHTCQGKGQSTLEACAERHLGIILPKTAIDEHGDDVRTSWGKWKGRPTKDIPPAYLEYLARD